MKKEFNKTLGAIADLIDVMESLRTDIIISDSRKKEDLQKIIFLLDDSVKLLVESITVFAKYEDLL